MRKGDANGELGPLESEVMELLWASGGPVMVRDVLGRLNEQRPEPLAYTTVMTVLSRLTMKGFALRRQQGRAYAYEPAAADAAATAVQGVLNRFGNAAVTSFVEAANRDPRLRRRLRRLIEDSA